MIPDSFIEELKYNCDVEKVISSYVNLKRKGRGLGGLCPFHSEKTPSFTVYTDTQSYYCFGCGAGGDVITFIRQIENLEYIEALKFLAEKAGMKLPEDTEDDKAARLKMRVLEINRESARFFHATLKSEAGQSAMEYLRGRGLLPRTITNFGLGYAPAGWDGLRSHLASKGFTKYEMTAAAVVAQGRNDSTYDIFRDRVIFPILDLRGNVVGFGGRIMEGSGPKYLNSADTPVFKKSRGLYALNFAKEAKSDTLVLAEGYMDVIAIHQAGFPYTVATLGTALTPEQARLVSQYAKNVVIAYDGDEAGQKATKRAITLFSDTDVAVRVLEMEGAKDPDEYIKKYGAARFERLINSGKSAVRFEIDKLKARHDTRTAEGKIAFLNEFSRLMSEIPGELARDVYIGEIAKEVDVPRERIALTVKSVLQKKQERKRKDMSRDLRPYHQAHSAGNFRTARNTGAAVIAEEKLITILIQNPDYFDVFLSKLSPNDFSDEILRKIYEIICRRLSEGLSIQMIHLSAELDPGDMSRLSRLIAAGKGIMFSRHQADEYINALHTEKNKKSTGDVGAMSHEEYAAYITSLAAKKRGV